MNDLTLFEGDKLASIEKAAGYLSKSSLVPQTFRNKPAETFSALIMGHSLGLNPMQSLLEIHVIQGRPAISTKLMLALVKKQYPTVVLKWDRDSKKESVTLQFQLSKDDQIFTTTWDTARAAKMNLLGRDQYKKQLMTMLSWRCLSEAIRFCAPDAVLGLYSDDEAQDFKDPVKDDDVERMWRQGKTEDELTLGHEEYIFPSRKFANKKIKDIETGDLEKRFDYLEKRIQKEGWVYNNQDIDEMNSIKFALEARE